MSGFCCCYWVRVSKSLRKKLSKALARRDKCGRLRYSAMHIKAAEESGCGKKVMFFMYAEKKQYYQLLPFIVGANTQLQQIVLLPNAPLIFHRELPQRKHGAQLATPIRIRRAKHKEKPEETSNN